MRNSPTPPNRRPPTPTDPRNRRGHRAFGHRRPRTNAQGGFAMSDSKRITASKTELLELEKGFWTGDAAYYAANVDAECLVAFPRMAQAMDNADLAKTATNPNRWR